MGAIETEDYPVPLAPADGTRAARFSAVDILRGLLMVLMVVDHSRDYFSRPTGDPTDPSHASVALFATRWITHLCAPGFIALAGASVALQLDRGKTHAAVQRLLWTRGAWLLFLEVSVISFGWSFGPGFALQVIWVVGWAMIFLGCLLRLPRWGVGLVGAVICAAHNLLDGVHASRFGTLGSLGWEFFHERGPIYIGHQIIGAFIYPLVPWIGVICLGFWWGSLLRQGSALRQRVSAMLGSAMLLVFLLLRAWGAYGDPIPWVRPGGAIRDTMGLLQVQKYPPSLDYLLATLGVLLLLYAAADRLVERDWAGGPRRLLEVFGRVPFFFYVLHIYLLHSLALGTAAATGQNWRFWLTPFAVFIGHLPGWGYPLPVVYAVWAAAVLALWWPCRWFGQVKRNRRDWWLSYL